MNKLYPFATLLSAILLINGAQAQTYTAVRNGNWHVTSGPNVWDPSGEPPTNCGGCQITINSGVTVTLNAHVTLSGSSLLKIGSDGSAATALVVSQSGGADFGAAYNVILINDGSSPDNRIILSSNIDILNAGNASGYDGILTAYPSGGNTMYFKKAGLSPAGFFNTTVADNGTPAKQSLTGPVTLSGTGTLPIILTDFDAVVNNDVVDLTWTTRFEQNSDHFDIERSANGGAKWDVVGKVAAKGYSVLPVNYSFTDANPGSGTLQYRVHGYDMDGRSMFSSIKVIRMTPLAAISIFPNPAKDYVNVSLPASEAASGMISVRLIGQSGQLLAEKRATGGTILSFPVSSYAPGNYLVQVVGADGSKQVSKVLISKQ